MFDSFGSFFDELERKYGESLAVEFFSGENIIRKSYAELSADVRKCAEFIRSRCGDEPGRHVALIGEDIYDLMVCLYGCMAAGEVAIPLNPSETEKIVDYSLELVDTDLVLADGCFERRFPNAAQKYGNCTASMSGYTSLQTAPKADYAVEGDETILMLMTSGTTGTPKAVMVSLNNLFSPMDNLVSFYKVRTEPGEPEKQITVLSTAKLYHISGLTVTMSYLALGTVLALCTDMKYIYRDIEAFQPVIAVVLPVLIEAWVREIRHGHRDRLGTINTISTGAAPINESIAEMLNMEGIRVNQCYGMTEICGGIAMNPGLDPDRATAAGLPDGNCNIVLEDDEVTVSGPGVAKGYYKNTEATAEVFRNGRIYTGDLGYFDEKGYLFLTGRKKSIIVLSSGENVNPEELEQMIAGCAEIKDVMVYGKEGKLCAGLLVSEEDKERVEGFIREMNRTLPTYKRITMFEYVNEPFERTASGKLRRLKQSI